MTPAQPANACATLRHALAPMPQPAAVDLPLQAQPGLLLLDAQHRIVAANAQAESLLGAGGQALLGTALASLFPLPVREQQVLHLTQAAAGSGVATPAPLSRCRLLRADGSEALADLALTGLPATASVVVTLNPPPTQAAVEDWRLLLQRFQAVVELSPIAIWIAEDDAIRFANSAATRLVAAASSAAVVGRSVRSLLRPDAHAELQRQVHSVLSHPGALGSLQATLLRHEGQPRQVEIALTALPDHGHTTVQMVVHDVTQRQREMRELERSRHALRRLSANIVEGRESERQRIARELHDELGQSLSVLKLELTEYTDMAGAAPHRARLEGMLARIDGIVGSVRRIAADLRPLMLDELGPGPAIEWLVQDFARRSGLHCSLLFDDIGTLEDDHAAIALYRMVQEALTNVLRHARATEVRVELKRQDDSILVSVCDNGVGLPAEAPHRDSQFGLLGMRERADMLGGELQLDPRPGGGTCVRMRVPIEPGTGRRS